MILKLIKTFWNRTLVLK